MNTQTVCLPATITRNPSATASGAYQRILLEEGELMNWAKVPHGARLLVRDGFVWITQEGNGGDHVLGAGQQMRFNCRGSVVAESLLGGAAVEFFES